MTQPQAGITHDVVFTNNDGAAMGFMLAPGAYSDERADDFAPRIATGNDPTLREGIWDEWAITGAPEGIDQLTASNRNKILRSDGNVFLRRDQGIQLNAAWTSLDASKNATAPMIVDLTTNLVATGIGTKVRRYNYGAGTFTDSTTTFASDVVWLHRHNGKMFAGCGSGDAIQMSTDLNTWSEPAAGQSATCLTTWQAADGTVNLVCALGTNFKLSTDDGVTWGAAKAVGNPDSDITGLGVAFGLLVIGKSDGLYSYDGVSVNEIMVFPALKYAGNCRALVYHEGFLYTHVLGQVWKLSFSGGGVSNKVDITPQMLATEDERLYGHGLPVWIASGPQLLYVAFDDGESVYPEVLSYNDLGWHQEYRGASGDTMRALGYSRLASRLLLNDGATRGRQLTNLTDQPAKDYPASGTFYTSDFDGGLPRMDKAFRHLWVEVENLSSSGKLVFSYSKDKGANYTALADVTANGKQTLIFPDGDPVGSEQLRWRVVLHRNSATSSPVLRRMATSFLNRPIPVYVFSVQLRLANGQILRNGKTKETVDAEERLSFLRSAEASNSPVQFADLFGNEFHCYITRVARRLAPESLDNIGQQNHMPEWVVDVTLIKVDLASRWNTNIQWDAFAWA